MSGSVLRVVGPAGWRRTNDDAEAANNGQDRKDPTTPLPRIHVVTRCKQIGIEGGDETTVPSSRPGLVKKIPSLESLHQPDVQATELALAWRPRSCIGLVSRGGVANAGKTIAGPGGVWNHEISGERDLKAVGPSWLESHDKPTRPCPFSRWVLDRTGFASCRARKAKSPGRARRTYSSRSRRSGSRPG